MNCVGAQPSPDDLPVMVWDRLLGNQKASLQSRRDKDPPKMLAWMEVFYRWLGARDGSVG
ncbi:hypothetical protein HRbin17_01714 [bacterium HR17]|jgi:hypothetical protein|uniref:Uncharacterized protein n=1 Tax=Candidatus Fervidibacter japonicus TaxID=2035412 RepID=A0A2H5XDC9_9BACT|nr:hypothetical protein HRbin17_01714 [bacterium HR17]